MGQVKQILQVNRVGVAVDSCACDPPFLHFDPPHRTKLKRCVLISAPEFIRDRLQKRCDHQSTQLQFIQPGKSGQNTFVERIMVPLRKKLLDVYLFFTLQEAGEMAEVWRRD